jgi:hypothetical protein
MSVEQMRGYAHPYSDRKISEKQNEHDPERVKLRHYFYFFLSMCWTEKKKKDYFPAIRLFFLPSLYRK